MSTVDAATSSSAARSLEEYQKSQRTTGSKLDQEDFLKILVAQMSNQDPMEPSSNEDFLAQMAQFSALEAMTAMSASFASTQAYSMIGKYVYVQDGSDMIYGKVSGVVNEDGVNYLLIGDKYYDAKKVTGVMDSQNGLQDQIIQGASLIGKTVTAQITGTDNQTTTITGKVDKLVVKDGAVYAVVNGTNVPISRITEIATEAADQTGTDNPVENENPPETNNPPETENPPTDTENPTQTEEE